MECPYVLRRYRRLVQIFVILIGLTILIRSCYQDRVGLLPISSRIRSSLRRASQWLRNPPKATIITKEGKRAACTLLSSPKLITSPTLTNRTNWNFNIKQQCPKLILTNILDLRLKLVLECGEEPTLSLTNTSSSSDIHEVHFGDKCLQKAIDNCCMDRKPVPNVVHYVYYEDQELGYFQFLSYMSALRFMKPCLFLIHGEYLPYGEYWDYFISIFPNIIHVKRPLVTTVYGRKLAHKEHGSDVMRIEAIKEYGGVYLDWDEVLLRPVEPLRQFEYTQAQASPKHLTNAVIIGKRNATFLDHWHNGYKLYDGSWAGISLYYAMNLSRTHPELIHVDGYNFTLQNGEPIFIIFNGNYNWATNYAIHLYIRYYEKPGNLGVIRKLNTTIGAVSRHILYGNKELCSN